MRVPTVLVVDGANVIGSRPDGWWRDRAGAAGRLLHRLAGLAPRTVALPDRALRRLSRCVVVLEGRAREAADVPGVEVVRAPDSGDDAIVALAAVTPGCIVVTADRGLRARLPTGVTTVGPGTLHGWLARL
jgi:hypothetical protein